ncbi:hypothetical protein V1478_013194 [Vespula squamosa]|uniref:Uncharacterized protein n=1 Tax=Vespula squamosa TaxID=30214 RepID=A0ABD2AA46_VESSQ
MKTSKLHSQPHFSAGSILGWTILGYRYVAGTRRRGLRSNLTYESSAGCRHFFLQSTETCFDGQVLSPADSSQRTMRKTRFLYILRGINFRRLKGGPGDGTDLMGISGAIEANRSEGEQRAVAGAVEVNAAIGCFQELQRSKLNLNFIQSYLFILGIGYKTLDVQLGKYILILKGKEHDGISYNGVATVPRILRLYRSSVGTVIAVLPETWKEEAKKVMEETSLDRTLRFVEKVERLVTLKTKIHVYRNSSFDNVDIRVEIPLRPPVTIVELEIYLGRVTSPSDWHLLLLLLQHPSHGFPFDIIDTTLLDAYD